MCPCPRTIGAAGNFQRRCCRRRRSPGKVRCRRATVRTAARFPAGPDVIAIWRIAREPPCRTARRIVPAGSAVADTTVRECPVAHAQPRET